MRESGVGQDHCMIISYLMNGNRIKRNTEKYNTKKCGIKWNMARRGGDRSEEEIDVIDEVD